MLDAWSLIPTYSIHCSIEVLTIGIKEILKKCNLKFVGSSSNVEELIILVENANPNIIVLGEYTDSKLAKKIRQINSDCLIISNGIPRDINDSLCINDSFCLKDSQSLISVIEKYLANLKEGDFLIKKDYGSIQSLRELNLSETEKSILFKTCQGYTREQIALERQVQVSAVAHHLKSIRKKLHIDLIEQLIVFSFRSGFVSAMEAELDKLQRLSLKN
ncbi:MAG: LuxR C-terminal-related transcriptional regulator [Waterburya sp.]